jgi:hypothetical protein
VNLPIELFFGWPAGAVWSNLLASAVCSAGALLVALVKLNRQHRERVAQAERHHQALLAHVTATAKAGRRPLMSEEEFERNLAEMMPPLNCFGCGYSGPPAGHTARHDAFLAAMGRQRPRGGGAGGNHADVTVTPGSAEADQLAAEYQRQAKRRPGGERM